jgi:flagellar hook-associated protein 3 FlgL
MIRATRFGLFDILSHNTRTQMSALRTAQEQAITGLRINRPSDEPAALSELHRMDAAVRDQEVYGANAESADGILAIADGTLASVSDIVIRAREIAVAMAGDTVGADSRAIAAVEARGLYQSMLDVANTDINGRYLFSGTAYDTPPFADDGTYQGNTEEPTVQVGDDRWVSTSFDGSQVFQGSVDIFATLDALATALETDDPTTVSAALGALDLATDQVSSWRARVGTEMNIAEDAVDITGGLGVLMGDRLSQIVEVDPAEAYTRLTELQGAYEATLQIAASSTSSRTLFDLI